MAKKKDSLVKIEGEDLVVGSWDISIGFDVEHRSLTRLIKRYKNEFDEFGVTATRLRQPTSKKGGKPFEEFTLNEPQATYLTTLLLNKGLVYYKDVYKRAKALIETFAESMGKICLPCKNMNHLKVTHEKK